MASSIGLPALVDGGSSAYRTTRATGQEDCYELGANGHGPDGQNVAERLVEEIQAWNNRHRGDRAHVEVYLAGTPDDRRPAGRVIARPHTRVTISRP
ncbi:hypothetical protein [Streptomyces canus]|uniref:hypothetical protein n=1 Tax=Streptomyces canus TaxID=58343 RepID=UPI003718543F